MIRYEEESAGIFSVSLYQPRVCKAIVNQVKKIGCWADAEVRTTENEGEYGAAVAPEVRSASILPTNEGARVYDEFERKIDRLIKPLVRQIWCADLREHSGTQLIRYLPGGHYQAHKDAGLDLSARYFTVLCYLNQDFEGGRTLFPSLDYAAIPSSGKAIVFPSTYVHCAEPVQSGEKYALLSWIIGPPPIDWI